MAARKTKPSGRPKGSKGKAGATAKENIIAVFTRMGGTAKMAEWAQANQTEFYKLYGRLIPVDVDAAVGGSITVEWATGSEPPSST
jgi:hypothetical protein